MIGEAAEAAGAPQLHQLRRNVIVLKGALFPVRDAIAGLVRAEPSYVHRGDQDLTSTTRSTTPISLIELVETPAQHALRSDRNEPFAGRRLEPTRSSPSSPSFPRSSFR